MGADIISFTPPDETPIAAQPDVDVRDLADGVRDGVQQRLMSALINLQRADACLDQEPDRARELIREALGYPTVEPAEARDVSAGSHPTALTTHGLAAAVLALAQASAVPMTLDISASRCSRPVEEAAYFLIADALTNISERGNATRVHVAAFRAGRDLVVEMCDDGAAETDHEQDCAVADLRACVEGLDGTLQVLRQVGIGTRIRASFPNAGDAIVR